MRVCVELSQSHYAHLRYVDSVLSEHISVDREAANDRTIELQLRRRQWLQEGSWQEERTTAALTKVMRKSVPSR